MCGIVGVLGRDDTAMVLLDGLRRLEYRGYDSAGIATVQDGALNRVRAEGKIAVLEKRVAQAPPKGPVGIGHTRWATHGKPNDTNAHPQATARVALVHNGILENYQDLKAELLAAGRSFESETDTEVLVNLIDQALEKGALPEQAMKEALDRVTGAFAIAAIFADQPDLVIAARKGSPLVIGYGDGEMFLASDALALAPYTQQVSYLEDGDLAMLSASAVAITDGEGNSAERAVQVNAVSSALIGKGQYRHFMHKEIHEQPEMVTHTLQSVIDFTAERLDLPELPVDLAAVEQVALTGCGTTAIAGFIARYWIESVAKVPVDVDIASEFRYRAPPLKPGTLCIAISQSGETADTLAALRIFQEGNAPTLAILNQAQSSIGREATAVLKTLAGPEIGVASTKAFTTQLSVLAAVALGMAKAKGHLSEEMERDHVKALLELPARMADVLAREDEIDAMAQALANTDHVLYLGRGPSYPLAMEGALKLKEISYIHAEGYAAGELKHGPIALIDDSMPVVAIAPPDQLFEKTLSNIQQVRARGGRVFLFTDQKGAQAAGSDAEAVFVLPDVDAFAAPILYALPVQLLAYHTAVVKGTDVDQPRNLAKSVTVE